MTPEEAAKAGLEFGATGRLYARLKLAVSSDLARRLLHERVLGGPYQDLKDARVLPKTTDFRIL